MAAVANTGSVQVEDCRARSNRCASRSGIYFDSSTIIEHLDYSDWFLTRIEMSYLVIIGKSKSKAVPLDAMEAHRGRGGIVPTHS
jgi:hypothetical protein